MKKPFMVICAGAMLALLAGCSSNYVMTTKSGQTIVTHGKPQDVYKRQALTIVRMILPNSWPRPARRVLTFIMKTSAARFLTRCCRC